MVDAYFGHNGHFMFISRLILIGACILVSSIGMLIVYRFQFGQDIPYLRIVGGADLQQWGQLGDFFGGVLNPLLSFTALLAVLYNIKMQSEELALARKEAKTTNIIQRTQAKIFEKQTFDTTFFGLLNAHANMLRDVRITFADKTYEGRAAFEFISKRITDNSCYPAKSPEEIRELFSSYYEEFQSALGHYFRNLYHILKIIDASKAISEESDSENSVQKRIDAKDPEAAAKRKFLRNYFLRRQYSNILRAQLSRHEVTLLFINCLTEDGEGLKPYAELYSMLKTLKTRDILNGREDILFIFNPVAYADYEALDLENVWSLEKEISRSRYRDMLKKRPKPLAKK